MQARRFVGAVWALAALVPAACNWLPDWNDGGTAAAPAGAAGETDPAEPTTVAGLPPRRVLLVEGVATVDGKPAVAGMALGEKATVVTTKKARLVLALGPGSFVEIRPGTRVALGASARKTTSLRLLAGAAWSFIARDSSYEVVTGNAVAGVRGTTFYVETKGSQTYVCDCHGKLELRAGGPRALPRNVDSARQHVGTLIKGKGTRVKSGDAGRKSHTDEQAAALAALFAQAGGFEP